ncbi:mitochondrial cardiolipin hydrolase-like [Arctopsyche grandis]|uniref:mitochondrial cardiolipin hydrolase-like n=1 Tax=Arctopsyche grandis TaxID=121162 RepID=UPI00406D6F0B
MGARRAPVNVLVAFNDSGFRCEMKGIVRDECYNKYCCVHNLQRIVDFLDEARICIDICVYIFTSDLLARAVKKAHDRGVVVRIISDFDMAFYTSSHICRFYEQGIKIKSKNSKNLMHHKFCIIDSPSRIGEIYRVLVTGSLNWTNQATCGNWEDVLITSHLPIVELIQSEFNELWKTFKEFQPY